LEVYRTVGPLLPALLSQYIPAGVALRIRWRIAELVGTEVIGSSGMVLGGRGPAVLGRASALGAGVLGGRHEARVRDDGLEIGFRLEQ
jgi:hypothetical protein